MKQKGSALIIILILILLTIIGFFVYKDYLSPKGTILGPFVPSPTATADPTAGWKTYTNFKLGFSFKYPADAWTESSPVPEDTNAIVNLVSDEKIGDGVEPIVYYIRVSKSNKSSTQGYTDLQQVNGFSKGFSVYKTEQVLSRSGMLTYLFTKDNNVFIQFSIDPYNSASPFTKQGVYVPVFNQILSTFKFTGQTISGVKEGCIKLMDNPLAWDEANKTCNDVAGKNLELQNFCTENHGKYVDYANAACSFN